MPGFPGICEQTEPQLEVCQTLPYLGGGDSVFPTQFPGRAGTLCGEAVPQEDQTPAQKTPDGTWRWGIKQDRPQAAMWCAQVN